MEFNARECEIMCEIKLKISMDGDHVCVLYGENLQTGIAGFGLSIPEAFTDFALNWAEQAKHHPKYNTDAFLKVK
jgi:hypothetical protein